MLCKYGCGNEAIHKDRCDISWNRCPIIKARNSVSVKKAYDSGELDAKVRYKNQSQEIKDRMAWSKGKSSKEDSRIISGADHRLYGIGPGAGRVWSDESRVKSSKTRSAWLKVPENRKNYGRHKRSWMEEQFSSYLNDRRIDYREEVHFRNEEEDKNFFVDFLFDEKNLIIELDGTQHRNTVEADQKRDLFLETLGYTVCRISHSDFVRRLYHVGFSDILPD